ncbi:MAG: fibronectin type III domain-containing protein [Clostridia bacterium]|nr:fibronectin type III domain-containing protein [Clostridia bacterium]
MKKILGLWIFLSALVMFLPVYSVSAVNEGWTEENGEYVLYLKDTLSYSKKEMFTVFKTEFGGTSMYSYSIDEGESKIAFNSSGNIDFVSGKTYPISQSTTGIWEEVNSFRAQLYFTPLLKIEGQEDKLLEVFADCGKTSGTVELTFPAKSGYDAIISVGDSCFSAGAPVDGIHSLSIEINSSEAINVQYKIDAEKTALIKDVTVSGDGTVSAVEEGFYPEGIYTFTAIPSVSASASEGNYVYSVIINGTVIADEDIIFDDCKAVVSVMLEGGKEYSVEVVFGKLSFEITEKPTVIFEPDNYKPDELKGEIIQALRCPVFDFYKDNISLSLSEGYSFTSGDINVDVICHSDGRYPVLTAKSIPVTLFQFRTVEIVFIGEATAEYNGAPVAVEAVITDKDGKYYTGGETVIRYVGIDGTYDSCNAPTNAGTYNVTAIYKEYGENGILLAEGTGETILKIEPAEILLTINSKEKYVYENDPEFDCVISGTMSGNFGPENFVLSREKGNKAGVYRIYASFSENKNYNISVKEGKLTISHEPGRLIEDKGVPAECEKSGLTSGSHCGCCGEIFVSQKKIPSKGHNYISETTRSATCIEKGIIIYRCTECDSNYSEKTNSLGHSYSSSYTVDEKATYSEKGSKSRHCTRKGCNAKISVTDIPFITLSKVKGLKVASSVSQLKADWKAVKGAEKYTVELLNSKGRLIKAVTVKKTSYTFKKLSKATIYKIRVRAMAGENESAYSSLATVATAPPKVSKISVKSSKANSLSVTWGKVKGASGYEVQYSTSKKMKAAVTVTVKKGKITKLTVKKLKKGKKYRIRVRAYKSVGKKKIYGSWSAIKSIKLK